jgi:hypothetical protein
VFPRLAATAALLVCSALAGISAACREERPEKTPRDPARVSRAPATTPDPGYPFRREERAAVDAFLRANPGFRVATDADRRESESNDFRKLYGVYHPYFLRGDVNDDGILDFVLAFVRRDSDPDSPWFSIVVFAGKDHEGFAPGTFLERDVSLADGDLSVDRDSIVITPDTDEEDSARRYRWDPVRRSYVFVRDDTEEERGPATQT